MSFNLRPFNPGPPSTAFPSLPFTTTTSLTAASKQATNRNPNKQNRHPPRRALAERRRQVCGRFGVRCSEPRQLEAGCVPRYAYGGSRSNSRLLLSDRSSKMYAQQTARLESKGSIRNGTEWVTGILLAGRKVRKKGR